MAFDLGSIRARAGLDPSGFVSGLRSMETTSEIVGPKIVDLLNDPLLGTIRIVKEAGAAFVQTGVQIAGFIGDTAQRNRELDEWAKRLGLSAEVLSALTAEGKLHGIEMEDVADTIGELAVKARDANEGSTDLLKTFEQLGVRTTDNNGRLRSLEDILEGVARGLVNTENAALRYAIADELASDGAKRLLPVLIRLGTEGYDPLIQRAERFGDLLEQDGARASAKMVDSLNQVKRAADGLKQGLATEFIKGFIDQFEGSDDIRDVASVLRTDLAPAVREIGEATGSAVNNVKDFYEFLEKLIAAIQEANTTVGDSVVWKVISSGPRAVFRTIGALDDPLWDSIGTSDAGAILALDREELLQRTLELQRQAQEERERRGLRASGG